MYLNPLLFVVFLACQAFLFNGGLWSNAIVLVNVVSAAMLATSLFEPLASWLQPKEASYTFVYDFLAIWAVFAVAMIVMRGLTDALSKVKVRFKKPVDTIGGLLLSAWVGWVMVCFVLMTLHTAPLARNFMNGEFQPKPMDRMFYGLGPDRQWLAFVHKMSCGSLSRSGPKNNPQAHVFDPQGDFIFKYASRREQFEKQLETRVRVP